LLASIKKRPVLTFVALTFLISWGGILVVVGPAKLTHGQDFERLMVFAYPFMLLGPSVAGIVLTGLLGGRTGLRELRARALLWRVGARWYAVALFTAPIWMLGVLLALSLLSKGFLPEPITTGSQAFLLLYSLVIGLIVGVFQELGWTGFAVPRLRQRYGILSTGLIVGLLFGVWTGLIVFWESGYQAGGFSHTGELSLALYLPVVLLSWQVVYRVLMVWVYDRTTSLLLAMLMQASLVTCWTAFTPKALVGGALVIYYLILTAVLGAVVAALTLVNGRRFSRQKDTSAMPSADTAKPVTVPS
jgi:membrane protease YdiL (CAAX protease family)